MNEGNGKKQKQNKNTHTNTLKITVINKSFKIALPIRQQRQLYFRRTWHHSDNLHCILTDTPHGDTHQIKGNKNNHSLAVLSVSNMHGYSQWFKIQHLTTT